MTMPEFNLSETEFRRISRLVYDHCGINLHEGKKELVRARMANRLRDGNYRRVSDYLDDIARDPSKAEFTTLIDTVSTNLTSFFREPRHFEFLAKNFLPGLLTRKAKQGSTRIRAWSAGCSSGEEPYTLAMVLLDAIPDAADWDIKVLATDISTRVLRTAQGGVYPKERAQSVPPQIRGRYFAAGRSPGETVCQVAPDVRKLITFRHLNLMGPWPFTGPFDFIFCRNVMIYFDKQTQERLVGRFHDCLDKEGLLFTGHSESLTGINHRYRYVEPTIYAK
jgi:chemotaxis protein methyltransferase CheR